MTNSISQYRPIPSQAAGIGNTNNYNRSSNGAGKNPHGSNTNSLPNLSQLLPLLQQLLTLLQQNQGQNANKPVQTGTWGGEQIGMNVSKSGATLEFGCASGNISKPLTTNAQGHFSVDGTLTQRLGVQPADPDLLPKPQDVTYNGQIKNGVMTLDITAKTDGSNLGSYTLNYGKQPNIFYCL